MLGDTSSRLKETAEMLRNNPPANRCDLFMHEVIRSGAEYHAPPDTPTQGRSLFVVNLHGVEASGVDEAETIENWLQAAQSTLSSLQ